MVDNDHPTMTNVAPLNSMDENLIRENDDVGCGIEIDRDYNEIFRNSYQNLQVLF